jgi:hypothetical protein
VRLIALYSLIPTLFNVEQAIEQTMVPSGLPALALPPAFATLALALVLWLAAPAIGRAMSWSQEPLQGLGLDLLAVAQVGFAALGLLLAVLSTAGFVQALTAHLATIGYSPPGVPAVFQGELAGTAAQIVLGICVFLGRRGLARVVTAVRNY